MKLSKIILNQRKGVRNLAKTKVQKKEQALETETQQEQALALNPIVAPVVSPAQAKEAWDNYQALCKALLVGNDYQPIAGKSYKKKSAWRKLATAFNISVEVVKEERKEYTDSNGKPYFVWEVSAKASAMNGRSMSGLGSCASNERTFAHVEHDVRATAETRAKNRAISDLIGAGEVSAEEMEGVGQPVRRVQSSPKPEVEEAETVETKETNGKPSDEYCPKGHDHSTLRIFTVNKEGKNQGKSFVSCDSRNGGCGFFKWVTEDETAQHAEQVFGHE